MVGFSVFNELSLPFPTNENIVEKFLDFFKVLEETKKKGLNTLRLSRDFKEYEILQGVYFEQFVNRQKKDFQLKILSVFMNDGVVLIDSPIIKEEDTQKQEIISDSEYFYDQQPNDGGLACCDIWNTLAISFNSDIQWDKDKITLQKETLSENTNIVRKTINIIHSSKIDHLKTHQTFFNNLEKELKLNITQKSFWGQRKLFFSNIIFCPEVESQICKLDKEIFEQAISILRDVETQDKLIYDFNYSRESETVRNDPDLMGSRKFTVNGEKKFFENHLKSLSNSHRIYFLEQEKKIHIGYIGKHLKGKKDK